MFLRLKLQHKSLGNKNCKRYKYIFVRKRIISSEIDAFIIFPRPSAARKNYKPKTFAAILTVLWCLHPAVIYIYTILIYWSEKNGRPTLLLNVDPSVKWRSYTSTSECEKK